MNDLTREIFRQLGGKRFQIMTGAKNFLVIEDGIQFQLPQKGTIRRFTVLLNGKDLYDLALSNFNRKTGHTTVLKTESDIYNEDLQEAFTRMTGLYTRL